MRFLSGYFTTSAISLGFLSALSASAFIYLYRFGFVFPYFQALLGLLSLLFWLKLPKTALFWSGLLTGIFWFWWIGLSFRYYDLTWMIPLVIPAVGLVYGVLFGAVGLLPHPALRAVAIGVMEYIHPFGFDWFRPALLFVHTPFGERLWQFWVILAVLTIVLSCKHKARFLALFGLFFALYRPPQHLSPAQLADLRQNLFLAPTRLPQDLKWSPRYRGLIIQNNLAKIKQAIHAGKKAVILPESAFPLYLNRDMELTRTLLDLSAKITILTGALFYDRNPYNSAYLFQNKKMRVMHKVVPVPFGEASPLPLWMSRWINTLFFDGAKDYASAKSPSDFSMAGYTWRNAICYEATSDRLFAGNPRLMAAMSNNAWFTPSTQSTLQRLLLQLQADRHGTVIFHVTNGPGTDVIVPREK